MPLRTKIECPNCETDLIYKRGGRCSNCGADITDHIARTRLRERRTEQVVAIISTMLVIAVFLFTTGIGLLEGIAVYGLVGAAVFYLGKRTFS